MMTVTYICRGAKNKVANYSILFIYLLFFYIDFFNAFFWAFHNKESSQTREKNHQKNLGSSQKMWLFLLHFFPPSVVLFDFFIAFLGVS
jgi:hypothetical protein